MDKHKQDNSKGDGDHAEEERPLNAIERAGVISRLIFYLSIAGLVCTFGYFIARELFPTRLSPNSIFNDAIDVIRDNPEVTGRIGTGIKCYGLDHGGRREGRRNFIQHDEFEDENGITHMRIKFNAEGSSGKRATVYAERLSTSASREFSYVIFEPSTGRRREKAIAIIDNRPEKTLESEQIKTSTLLANSKAVLYGADTCKYTMQQKNLLGDHFDKVAYVQCDVEIDSKTGKRGLDICKEAGVRAFPTWYIGNALYPGVKSLKDLQQISKRSIKYLKTLEAQTNAGAVK